MEGLAFVTRTFRAGVGRTPLNGDCAFRVDLSRRGSERRVERSETSGFEVPSQILRKLRMTVLAAPR